MANQNDRKRFFSFKAGVFVLGFILLFADFLANDKPLICHCGDRWQLPVLEEDQLVSSVHFDTCSYVVWAPVRYSPYTIDKKNGRYTSPLTKQDVPSPMERHWLGTDQIGRDVAAGILHGARLSLLIGLSATFFGLFLGLPYGLFLGYYQDNGLRWNVIQVVLTVLFLFLAVFYGAFARFSLLTGGLIGLAGIGVFYLLFVLAGKRPFKKYAVPLDLLGFRILEWRKSIPALFLLLGLLTIFSSPSVGQVILVIGLLSWSDIARVIRAETLSVKNRLYVMSAVTMGFSHFYIIWKYILPGLKNTVLVMAVYMMAGSVLLEATLSFLGIGLPVEEVTWGKMLASSRDVKAWWMAVFPGGCLVLLLYWLHSWSDYFTRR